MKRFVLVLLVLLVAFGLSAELKFSGSTAATAYTDTAGVGVLDADEDITLGLGPLSLALNAGYTLGFPVMSHTLSFSYTLSASQALGPFTFAGSLASNGLSLPIGGVLSGDFLGDITASVAFAKDALSAKAAVLCTAKAAYPFFMGTEISATYAPKWGSLTIGGTFLDAQAVTDGVGYSAAPAAVEGLGLFAKAKVSY